MKKERLPILEYRQEIVDAVASNSVVVITAETGAGKSTQVPQFLLDEGYEVVVTQPRRLAARTVAERVAEEVGCKLGGLIGYRTAFEREDSRETQVLFCTDGLQLVREITGTGRAQVLVIDEVHEWNINIETLVAWAKRQIANDWQVKVVLMSATLEADKLAKYFGEEVPVVEVPGRLFPVEEKEDYSYNLVDNIKTLVAEGRNVLVFQPGKKEIAQTITDLEGIEAVVLPLHGELDPSEQRKCFWRYDKPKVVVATNVAQTSVTIPDIDAVVDSGVERRVELVDGIEGLYLKPISQADCQQRKGRAGRTKKGKYFLCGDSFDDRQAFPKAEIERSRLDQTVLRLANVGIDATELEFFHQPDCAVLADAKRALFALGAMTKDGQVTKIGRLMAKLPLSVQFSRMIVEADELGVVDDVVILAAILEIGSIRDRSDKWRAFTQEAESDLLAELDLWEKAKGQKAENLPECGIFKKSYFRVKELRRKLSDSLRGTKVRFGSSDDREAIKRACVAGMVDHLYKYEYGGYRNGGNGERQKARESVVSGSPEWIVGLPKDIQFKNRRGRLCTLNLVSMITKVDPAWLVEVAPQLSEEKTGLNPRYEEEIDLVASTTEVYFNGQLVQKLDNILDREHPEGSVVFARWLAGRIANGKEVSNPDLQAAVFHNQSWQKRAKELNIRAGEKVFDEFSSSDWENWLVKRLDGARRAAEIKNFETLKMAEVPADKAAEIEKLNPEILVVSGIEDGLKIQYGRSWNEYTVRASVSEDFIRNTKLEQIELPSGRIIELICGSYSSKSIPELLEKLEQARIEKEKKETKSKYETSWISDAEKVIAHETFQLLLSPVQAAVGTDGKPILAYVSLYSDSYSEFCFKLRDNEEEAKVETAKGFERLLKKMLKNVLVVPDEEPFKTKGSWGNWDKTDMGRALEEKFQSLVGNQSQNLTPQNFSEQVKAVKTALEAVKTEIGGKYIEAQAEITQSQNLVETEIEKINSDNRYFVEAEISQAREALERAKKSLKDLAYDSVQTGCEMAMEMVASLSELVKVRSEKRDLAQNLKEEIWEDLWNLKYGDEDFRGAEKEEKNSAETLIDEIDGLIDSHRYELVAEKVEQARQLIENIRRRQARIETLLKAEYAHCPVCSAPIGDGYHYCDEQGQSALMARGEYSEFEIKVSCIGERKLVSLVAEYNDDYNQFQAWLTVDSAVLDANLDAEIITESQWSEPSENEREIASQIAELDKQLGYIETEREHLESGSNKPRVEITFAEQRVGGQIRLQAEGIFTGEVENRKAENGWSEYENQPVIFSLNRNSAQWLDEPITGGQAWICTVGFQIAVAGGKPVIVVNPQVRTDIESGVQAQIADLKKQLVGARQANNKNSKQVSAETDMTSALSALQERFA